MGIGSSAVTLILFLIAVVVVIKAIRVVPQQHAWVVERLGRFHAVLAPVSRPGTGARSTHTTSSTIASMRLTALRWLSW